MAGKDFNRPADMSMVNIEEGFMKGVFFIMVLFKLSLANSVMAEPIKYNLDLDNPEKTASSLFLSRDMSLRVKALGEEFAGIISDGETDALLNPARLAEVVSPELVLAFPSEEGYGYGKSNALSFLGMWPRALSNIISAGFFLKEAHYEDQDSRSYTDEDYWENTLRSVLSYEKSTNFLDDYHLRLFSSLNIPQSLKLGLEYSYSVIPEIKNRWSRNEVYYINNSTWDTLDADSGFSEYNNSHNISSHRFRVGALFNISTTTSFELFGDFFLWREDTIGLYNRDNFVHRENEYYDYQGEDTIYYYNIASEYYNSKRDSADSSAFRAVTLNTRWIKEMNDDLRFHLLIGGAIIQGTLSGNNTERNSMQKDLYSSLKSESVSVHGDTLHYKTEKIRDFSGDEKLYLGTAGIGIEKRILNRSLVCLGLKFIYGQEEINQNNTWFSFFQKETTALDTTHSETTYVTKEKYQKRSWTLILPMGMEHFITPQFILRLGVCPRFLYEKAEGNSDSEYKEKIEISHSLGLGYKVSDYLSFDLFTRGLLHNIPYWNIQVKYYF